MRVDGDASDKPLDIAVLTRMKHFRAMNKLKKVALKVNYLLLSFCCSHHEHHNQAFGKISANCSI